MAKSSQALEDALRYTLTDTNLPSQYPDFQALTRDLIRRLSPFAVVVDRETYNQLTKPQSQASKGLEEVTARYKAHNDSVEAGMRQRGSIPPSMGGSNLAKYDAAFDAEEAQVNARVRR